MNKIWTALLFSSVLFGLIAAGLGQAQEQPSFSDAEKAEIEQVIRNYILENPEIIPQAVQILQQRERQRQQAEAKAIISKRRESIENDGVSPVLGNPDSATTVVEFYDYQCAYCRWSYSHAVAELIETKGENIRYVFKQFPVLDSPGDPPVSRTAAKAALAAEKQGKFQAFHHAMMTREGSLDIQRIFRIAEQAGLNVDKLRADMDDPEIEQSIRQNLSLGRAIGITGTPAYIVGGELVPGAQDYESLLGKVEKAAETAIEADDNQAG